MGPEQYQAYVTEPGEAFATTGANVLQDLWLAAGPAPMLIATGSTPMPIYAELARRVQAEKLETPSSKLVQLDEYVGVGEEDARSLYGWMQRSFLGPLRISGDRVIRLRGDTADPDGECARFEASVRELGGLGIAIVGLGPNGHIGFNEPPSPASAPSRMVALTPESLASNAGYWDGLDVPTHALTAGLSLILDADVVVLVVQGEHKRDILNRTLRGPETDDVPASHLRRARRLVVVADIAAHP